MFLAFGIHLDSNLRRSLRNRASKKRKKRTRCETKEGKIIRGRVKNEKFAVAKKIFFDELRTGMAYESGIALKAAAKTVKDSPEVRNPKGTLPENMRCKYHHPRYCNKRGHADAHSPSCHAEKLSTKEREVVLVAILREAGEK